MIFILRTPIMRFYPNLTLRNTGTVLRVGGEEFHQEPEYPSTFMKMVKEKKNTDNVSCK
jgi:hypothetical protein